MVDTDAPLSPLNRMYRLPSTSSNGDGSITPFHCGAATMGVVGTANGPARVAAAPQAIPCPWSMSRLLRVAKYSRYWPSHSHTSGAHAYPGSVQYGSVVTASSAAAQVVKFEDVRCRMLSPPPPVPHAW